MDEAKGKIRGARREKSSRRLRRFSLDGGNNGRARAAAPLLVALRYLYDNAFLRHDSISRTAAPFLSFPSWPRQFSRRVQFERNAMRSAVITIDNGRRGAGRNGVGREIRTHNRIARVITRLSGYACRSDGDFEIVSK